jgi:ribosome-associated toxin RatA of RatAB toxin-antitoxin module
MIRKFGHLDAAPDRVRDLFAAIEAWPLWMAGVRSARVLQRSGDTLTFEMEQESFGRRFRARLEGRLRERSLSVTQTSGWFRRWEMTWRFLPPPDGDGTTLGMEVDFELKGILGQLVPTRLIQVNLDRLFSQVIEGAERRLGAAPAPAGEARGQVILRLLETRHGLEVEIAGKRLRIPLRKA